MAARDGVSDTRFGTPILNRNFLSPTGFKFALKRSPGVAFFCNQANIPSLDLGVAVQPSYLKDVDVPGDKIQFGDLTLRFLVDEDLVNYMEIHNWLISLGYPESFDQNAFKSGRAISFKNNDVYSDGSLIVMSSNQNPNLNINFEDMFPVSLSELTFDASLDDIQYLEATVTFRYKLYTIDRI